MEIRRSGEMSSPKSVVVGGQVREGTRVVLREITAMLHNSPPSQTSRRKVTLLFSFYSYIFLNISLNNARLLFSKEE